MEQRLRARTAVLGLGVFLTGISGAFAAPPLSPRLPTGLAEYYKYAVTDLPNHYKNPQIAQQNNTPVDNPITDAGATLGRVLFYDKRMSHGDGVACASCHRQQNGFSDPNEFSTGFDGQQTGRHSMGITNAVYYANGKAFWDERAASLEEQALLPIQSEVEMGMTLPVLVAKLGQTDFYPKLFEAAFGTPEITPERIGKAIAQFERSMVSYKSKYDSAFGPAGPPNFAAVFTAQELAGRDLFHGQGQCAQCHTTHAQVGAGARNIGLDLTNDEDPGAGDGKFKTTSLRNVGVRERFMHDGRFASLEEVIEFYSTGVQANPHLDPLLKDGNGQPLRLNWTPAQIESVVAFLNTLTDYQFLADVNFSDPFVTLPGDYDGNGIVGQDDYTVWSQSFGSATLLSADGNGDGVVNAADYTIWRDNFGATWEGLYYGSGGGALAQGVPEPASFLLFLLAAGWMSLLRRRSGRVI
jgi:cytochrome c peroxidase